MSDEVRLIDVNAAIKQLERRENICKMMGTENVYGDIMVSTRSFKTFLLNRPTFNAYKNMLEENQDDE